MKTTLATIYAVLAVSLLIPQAFAGFVIAHRGAETQAPENTLASQRLAYEMGAEVVECDLRLTMDGACVILHDHTLERTTNGTGLVWQKTLAEMRSLDAGAWFGAQYAGEKVPLLSEMLDVARVYRKKLMIDVKGEGWARLVRNAVDTAGLSDESVMFLTWSEPMTRDYRAQFPGSRIMIVSNYQPPDATAANYAEYRAWGANDVFFNSSWFISRQEIARCHANGMGASLMRTTPAAAYFYLQQGLDSFWSQALDETMARFQLMSGRWQAWAAAKGLPPEHSGCFADPDGDGNDNLTEYVLGGAPMSADAQVITEKTSHFSLLPRAGGMEWLVELRSGWDEFATINVQYSSDLVNWVDAAAACCTTLSPTRRRFLLPADGAKRFYRLNVDVIR